MGGFRSDFAQALTFSVGSVGGCSHLSVVVEAPELFCLPPPFDFGVSFFSPGTTRSSSVSFFAFAAFALLHAGPAGLREGCHAAKLWQPCGTNDACRWLPPFLTLVVSLQL